MIHVYTGQGKGKTTAALGLALRACGAGKRVYIGQFLKSGRYSELSAFKKFTNVTVEQFGTGCFVKKKPTALARTRAAAGFGRIKTVAASGAYDIVILDEINCAVTLGLIPVRALVSLMRGVSRDIELVLTGRDADARVLKEADLVTVMEAQKHYFERGVQARKGIEY